jgi:iron complex outermembrane receptor protein
MVAPAGAHARTHAAPRAPAAPGEPVCTVRVAVADRTSAWAAPLDRIVSVRVPDSSVREALESVAALAGIELAYSNELLPKDKRVCLSLDRVPVGAALETVLSGTSLRLVVTGATQVVLAPTRAALVGATTVISRRASVLDRVVVTGTPDGASQRGSPFALDVVDGAALSRTGALSLSAALELALPGIWTWSGTAGTLSARFGSIRGASSFGVTTPKIYLDGVEVANPLLVTQLDASRVDRVEVIRGPQGAALYGADAISGVISILTRHDGTASGAPSLQLSSNAGVAATEFSTRDAFVQNHGVSLRGGSRRGLFGLGLNLSTVGPYVPGASERHLLADGDVRLVRDRSVLTATARLSVQHANASTGLLDGSALSPIRPEAPASGGPPSERAARHGGGALSLPNGVPGGVLQDPDGSSPATETTRVAGDSAGGQEFSHYTVGATATMMPSLRWTNTIVTGVDGYRLHGLSGAGDPVPLTYQADPSPGQGAADRGSLRARAVGRFDLGRDATLSLAVGAEHALTRESHETALEAQGTRGPDRSAVPGSMHGSVGGGLGLQAMAIGGPVLLQTTWTNNTGILAQANFGWRDALFLVAGGRAERTTGATPNAQTAYLPMLGATYVYDLRGTVLKVRGAYGTGIRPAHSLARAGTRMGRAGLLLSGSTLQPESQSGVEGGIDLLFGSGLGVHVTRFDQRASGLIQPVASTVLTAVNGRAMRLVRYSLQNVGAIDNRGWELQGSTAISRLRLSGAYTIVDSRVSHVDPSYGGDLRAGDRMLDVPARTLSATAAWSAAQWSTSATLARAEDWIGYDRIAIAKALSNGGQPVNGAGLRAYWARYDDVTRLRANIAYRFSRQLTAELGGENLLNVQRAGPDNTSVTAGRTVTFGLRAQF